MRISVFLSATFLAQRNTKMVQLSVQHIQEKKRMYIHVSDVCEGVRPQLTLPGRRAGREWMSSGGVCVYGQKKYEESSFNGVGKAEVQGEKAKVPATAGYKVA